MFLVRLLLLLLLIAPAAQAQSDAPNPLPAGIEQPPHTPATDRSDPNEPREAPPPASAQAHAPPAQPPVEHGVPPPPVPPGIPRTEWLPFNGELARTAEGSLDACEVMALPLTIVPGVGDLVGTVADWLCIVPTAMAVDHVGTFHGRHVSHFWEPALALVVRNLWTTAVDTPIVVVTIAVIVGATSGSIVLSAIGGVPVTVVVAGSIAVTAATYTALKAARDGVGDLLFVGVYNLLVRETDADTAAAAMPSQGIQPGVGGVTGGFGLMATVAGSKAPFSWSHVLPVVGPIWRASERSTDMKLRTRRYGAEVLGVNKRDLSAMDNTADALNAIQGWSTAAAHVGLGLSGAMVAGALIASRSPDTAHLADPFGAIGLVAASTAAGAFVVSALAEKVQPIAVPVVFSLAE
jgi:hypothetical protein